MADRVILLNGLPGAGKSTLGVALAPVLAAKFVSKDRIKEALADAVGLDVPGLGMIAMEAVWSVTAATPATVVIDSWWWRPRDLEHARHGLRSIGSPPAVEIWCDLPGPVARARVAARRRHPCHLDGQRLAEDWEIWAATAEPLALTPVVRVDTTAAVDVAELARALYSFMGRARIPTQQAEG